MSPRRVVDQRREVGERHWATIVPAHLDLGVLPIAFWSPRLEQHLEQPVGVLADAPDLHAALVDGPLDAFDGASVRLALERVDDPALHVVPGKREALVALARLID